MTQPLYSLCSYKSDCILSFHKLHKDTTNYKSESPRSICLHSHIAASFLSLTFSLAPQCMRWMIRGSIPSRDRCFSIPKHQNRLCGPPNFLFSECRVLFPGVRALLRDVEVVSPRSTYSMKDCLLLTVRVTATTFQPQRAVLECVIKLYWKLHSSLVFGHYLLPETRWSGRSLNTELLWYIHSHPSETTTQNYKYQLRPPPCCCCRCHAVKHASTAARICPWQTATCALLKWRNLFRTKQGSIQSWSHVGICIACLAHCQKKDNCFVCPSFHANRTAEFSVHRDETSRKLFIQFGCDSATAGSRRKAACGRVLQWLSRSRPNLNWCAEYVIRRESSLTNVWICRLSESIVFVGCVMNIRTVCVFATCRFYSTQWARTHYAKGINPVLV